ncbi:MAG TPA: VOC family protein [Micromonosporaceae bacterium]|jgi:predicted enzyme related to lactoylglutathione lyase
MRIEFTLDCTDLEAQARFWAGALGCGVEGVIEDRYILLSGDGISLTLQRVPEAKTVKNRMHIDLLVHDLPTEVSRLESLGATRLTPVPLREYGQTWYVMADPEGNEFCLAGDPSAGSVTPLS